MQPLVAFDIDGAALKRGPFSVTVPSRHAAIEYRHGAFTRVLPPGKHRAPFGTTHIPVDLRERLIEVAPQEILTADAISVRVSAAVRLAVTDAQQWVEGAVDPTTTIYLATQVALREALGSVSVDALIERGAQLPMAEITAAVHGVAGTVGAQVHEVIVKDVILPAELRHAAAEVATAKAKGLAQLEAARAETAALRSLANGAKLLDQHPALATLRMIQSAPMGSQIVLRVGDESVTEQ
ncbi:slipin family protein [Janibacter sp. GXQ6167]|uniref:slipin family protein n=1 Tax=Janibacter sp. GXQ6167 TaxID=3240791 RepID=UPI0035250A3D